jgi:hypothetical protein
LKNSEKDAVSDSVLFYFVHICVNQTIKEMRIMPVCIFLVLLISSPFLSAQQQITIVGRCGGSETVTIPVTIDNDLDGMDDLLEQKLLDYFMPVIIQFSGESCPGPALDGSGDSNLVVCHIYPLPGQYTMNSVNPDSLKVHPAVEVSDTGLMTGMIWYDPFIVAHCALLYGKDCGSLGHTADVEGFSFTLKYTGPDAATGWMYDTTMANWMGAKIQTISHANTVCEQVETYPYKSALFPNGLDTIYASPDKHGNYLTVSKCGSSFICNPSCSGTPSRKSIRIVNVGEEDAPMVNDLGTYYSAYAGEDPWGSSDFLESQSGSAGPIKNKTAMSLSADFISSQKLDTASQICDLYRNCYSCGDSAYNSCLQSGNGVTPGTIGFSPSYQCKAIIGTAISISGENELHIYPVPATKQLQIIYTDGNEAMSACIFDSKGVQVKRMSLSEYDAYLDISDMSRGIYFIQLISESKMFNRKFLVE